MAGIEHVREVPGNPLGGKSGAKRFYVLFVGKPGTAEYPYQVANDRVASEIGRALGLWVPDSVVYAVGGEHLFFSHFVEFEKQTEGNESVPPRSSDDTEAVLLAPRNAAYRHGVVMFDLFVANNDRKPDNIVVDDQGRIWLIDHGNALFYRPYTADDGPAEAGVARLEAVEDDLAAMFDRKHHFLGWLTDWDLTKSWAERIAALPGFMIEHLVEALPEGIINGDERDALRGFLLDRRTGMLDMVVKHCGLFPSLPARDG